MGKHKPSSTARHKINKQARYQRKVAKKKLYDGLKKDPRSGYKVRGK